VEDSNGKLISGRRVCYTKFKELGDANRDVFEAVCFCALGVSLPCTNRRYHQTAEDMKRSFYARFDSITKRRTRKVVT
jgi:hypothetical protein